jgi:hypothetical protein
MPTPPPPFLMPWQFSVAKSLEGSKGLEVGCSPRGKAAGTKAGASARSCGGGGTTAGLAANIVVVVVVVAVAAVKFIVVGAAAGQEGDGMRDASHLRSTLCLIM